jgi:thiol-disulfide isomerase/thioredoxin
MANTEIAVETLNGDPEARLEYLIEAGVFEVHDDEVQTTVAFEDTRSIYADTYGEGSVPEETFTETVADLFDLSTEAARAQVENEEVSRHDVITYLSLQSFLDRDLPRETLALLAEMATEVGVGSPVPEDMRELTDADYRDFLESAGDAVVFVWKYPCDPCRRMKGELPEVLDRVPDDVAVAGVDGDAVDAVRTNFDVDSAPVVLLFADGEVAARHEGYTPPAIIGNAIDDVYDGDSS